MLVAALLSDLNSLSVCPHDAAVTLVNVHKSLPSSSPPPANLNTNTSDPQPSSSLARPQTNSNTDLQRANEIISLHYDVKAKHLESGLDADLLQARDDVNGVVQALSRG